MAEQNYNKAYEAYQQAVYRDSRNPTFWCSIGVLYFQINQVRKRDEMGVPELLGMRSAGLGWDPWFHWLENIS